MNNDLRPVFIGGCDRSGTTMLGDMLGASTNAFATPESQSFHELLPLMHVRAFATPVEAARWLGEHFRFATWEMAGGPEKLAELVDLDDPRGTMIRIVREYLRQNHPEKLHAGVWVDHTPDNFKHYTLLRHYFPDARYVHIVRDGRDVFNSVRGLDWGPNNAYMGTRFWAGRLREALAVEISEGLGCLRVHYEDILRNPEGELARVCEHAQVPYADSMVDGGGLVLPGFTRGQHQLVGSRPDPSRIGQWRERMSAREIAEFEAYPWTRTLLKQLGYPLVTEKPQAPGGFIVLLRYIQDFLSYGINRARHRMMERKLLRKQAAGAESQNAAQTGAAEGVAGS